MSDYEKKIENLLNMQTVRNQEIFDLFDEVEYEFIDLRNKFNDMEDSDDKYLLAEEIYKLKEVKELLEEFDTSTYETFLSQSSLDIELDRAVKSLLNQIPTTLRVKLESGFNHEKIKEELNMDYAITKIRFAGISYTFYSI